jgi:hypothetical protein
VVRVPAYVGAGVVGVRGDTAPRPPRSCSCCWVAVGKSSAYYSAPQGARRQPWSCVGCKKPIVWGDRCEACKKELRRRVARKRR